VRTSPPCKINIKTDSQKNSLPVTDVAGVTFSDFDSAVPKFLNQGPEFFKFENPTLVKNPATIINTAVIYPCFYLKYDHTDSCYW